MKKTAYLILTFVLTTCLLTACRNGSMNETSAPTTQGSTTTQPNNGSEGSQNNTGTPDTTGIIGDIIEDATNSTTDTNRNRERAQPGLMN